MNAKVFTVEEANRILPSIIKAFNSAKRLNEEIESKRLDYEFVQLGTEEADGSVQVSKLKTELQTMEEEFNRKMRFLAALGAHVKSLSPGLVDFFSLREGKVVFLCWKEGETEVRYWHELDKGFAGRQEL